MKKKDVSTIKNSIYYESDEHMDTISDVDIPTIPVARTNIMLVARARLE